MAVVAAVRAGHLGRLLVCCGDASGFSNAVYMRSARALLCMSPFTTKRKKKKKKKINKKEKKSANVLAGSDAYESPVQYWLNDVAPKSIGEDRSKVQVLDEQRQEEVRMRQSMVYHPTHSVNPDALLDDVDHNGIPQVWGSMHSMEDFSCVDGPGIRVMVFLQGCFRRCSFCCNPDTWQIKSTANTSSKAIARRLQRDYPYLVDNNGGVTVSGGEPTLQPDFVSAVFREAHELGLTTTLDTSGWGDSAVWDKVLPHADLVMMCIKAMDPTLHKELTGAPIRFMKNFAAEVGRREIPLQIRYVMLPGITDTRGEVDAMIEFAHSIASFHAIEVLPYHQLGVQKWDELNIPYPFESLKPPPHAHVFKLIKYLEEADINVICHVK